MNSFVNIKCPLCQSDAKSLWPEVKVCKCQSCNLIFRSPALSMEELEGLYQTSWKDPMLETDETGATNPELAEDFVSRLAKSLGLDNLKGLRILDYGAGRGAMLKALMDAGVDAYGVEPFGYEFLQQNGFKVFRALDELPKGIFFDGIVSLDVIEHVQVPWDDYKKLNYYLAENGWLYLSTPNAAGINAHFYRSKWREIYNRGHLYFFTPMTLERVLEKGGYNKMKRLRWFINYRRGVITSILHQLFQIAQIDGELRYLAFK